MPRPNDRIGPYQLIRKLGKGSFGEVWLAQPDKKESSPVAVKLPNDPDLDFDALLQETAVWARAGRHPNVVEFIAARVFDHQAVIVSEYVLDGSLEQWLKRNGGRAPSIESAIEMICGILDGLEHLHSKSIIHRDIKPANILMHGTTPRLADFGHSRVLASTMHSSIVAGTPAYMAPEAFDAVRNEQTDVWSVGVLLYQMLVGLMPFPQRDAASLMKAILMTDAQPLSAELPPWLRQVVEKALSKDTAQRFQSAKEMRVALLQSKAQPVRENRKVPEPVVFPERSEPEVEQPTIKRGKVVVDLAPEPEPPREVPQRREQKTVSPPTPTRQTGLRPAMKLGGALAAIVLAVAAYLMTRMTTIISPNSLNSIRDSLQSAASLSEFSVNLANGVKVQMVNLPGGEFTMGGDRYDDEKPPHQVKLSPFAIGKCEVTQAQWKAVMGNNPSRFQGDNLPVELVSYEDIQSFLKKLGNGFRLPTEAEWEYAARAGTGTKYSFGDDEKLLREYAWFGENSDGKTYPVGEKKPNRFGLYDMHGNVWEWCSDWYGSGYYDECQRQGTIADPQGPGTGSVRVIRGGSWLNDAVSCRTANRGSGVPDDRSGNLGFRLVRIGR
ncbi:MAG: SUMF1/EgtB/PvdO family nonheme iron enzyme [Acidobacteria bacterium]|nr:SUMF1/EgtB/PvdO family nonheme iron enzyme [Acidobacteriota bacterium]